MNKAQSTIDQGTKKSNAVAEKVAAGALAVSIFEDDHRLPIERKAEA